MYGLVITGHWYKENLYLIQQKSWDSKRKEICGQKMKRCFSLTNLINFKMQIKTCLVRYADQILVIITPNRMYIWGQPSQQCKTLSKKTKNWGTDMTQQVKELLAKPGDLSLISETHVVEQKPSLPTCLLTSAHIPWHMLTLTHTHKYVY